MAFQSKDLSVLAYANGFTLWHYTTPDPVPGDGYFDNGSDMVRTGDFINTNFATGEDEGAALLVITKNADGCVSVREMLATDNPC